ncbi:MAG TPA: polysaccharide biosynthesis tyrosine autokinase, partial [Tepidisphaeraceae bacterium]|nr:polysaccharide biosynthesis tyrosine autokinase [Tepidisphaeraceae bacterium]
MTTLPQTTTVRLPQHAVSGVPGPAYGPAGTNAAGAFQMSGADVWRVIRANLWLIIILAVVFGAIGYVLFRYWLANYPSYTTVGLLEIRTEVLTDPVTDKIRDMSDTRITTLARTQAELLRSPGILSRALQNDEIRATDWFAGFRLKDKAGEYDIQAAKKDLEKKFSAYPVPDTAVLRVSMTCSKPGDAVTIAQKIVDLHLQDQKTKAEAVVTRRNTALKRIKDEFDRQIATSTQTVQSLQESVARAGGGVEGMFSSLEVQLRALLEERSKVTGERDENKSMADSARAQLNAGKVPFEVQKTIENDGIVTNLTMEQMRTSIQEVVGLETLGSAHKDINKLNAQYGEIEKKLSDRREELRVKFGEQYASMLEGMAQEKSERLVKIDKQIDELNKLHASLSSEIGRLQLNKGLLLDLTQQRQQVNNVISNITASQDADSLTPISWSQQPTLPDMPSWPKLLVFVPVGIMLGLSLAAGIAFLREFLDDTVRSPRDIVRVGQMNVLGMVADGGDDPQLADARLPIFDAPHSLTAEQFRQIRTRLQHATALDASRSLMITGPGPLDGKTTVAANLAAGLALNGRKILLVDANFRRPELHRLFGIGNEKGFSDVLNGTSSLDECLHTTRIPNLAIMTSGPKPLNVTELFESQLLSDFIERALEEHDHVIFDSAPLLVVSESVAMASRVDGVVTVVRAHTESRGLLQRMRETLRQVRAEHIGVVVNAVRAQGGGYYGRNIKAYYTY